MDKRKKLKRQVSNDGGMTWQDMIPYEYIAGELIERDSPDCNNVEWRTVSGYICTEEEVTPVYKVKATFSYEYVSDYETGEMERISFKVPYNGSTVLTNAEIIAAAGGVDMGTFSKSDNVKGSIANWVTEIGDNVLKTNAVVDVNIPSSVVRIGNNAYTGWYYGEYYNMINLPEGLTSIGEPCFNVLMDGSGTITIPSTVTSIGEDAFHFGGDYVKVVVANGNQYYYTPEGADSGIVERLTMTMLVGNNSGTIPSGILKIGQYAFSGFGGLATLTIPDSVTEIGQYSFYNCSHLTSVTLGTGITSIGNFAFYDCSRLTSITLEATTPPVLGSWAFDNTNNCPIYVPCASLNAYKTAWSTYANRIQCEQDYSREYLTISSLQDNNEIRWKKRGSVDNKTISVSTDGGQTWASKTSSTDDGTLLATLNTGDELLIKGSNSKYSDIGGLSNVYFSTTKNFDVYGNIMSLISGDNFIDSRTLTSSNNNAFKSLFTSCTHLINTSNLVLPATTLSEQCYDSMFAGCTSLVSSPSILPATTLAYKSYEAMFVNCTSLATVPVLQATTLAEWCCTSMFQGCTSLTTVPSDLLQATTLADYCYQSMFYGCTSLTTAPALPATTLAIQSYADMFKGCTNLNNVTCLATDLSASNCTSQWLSGVSSTGTFTKASGVTWSSGSSGIPTGWTIVDAT